jgi:hypothetical protein
MISPVAGSVPASSRKSCRLQVTTTDWVCTAWRQMSTSSVLTPSTSGTNHTSWPPCRRHRAASMATSSSTRNLTRPDAQFARHGHALYRPSGTLLSMLLRKADRIMARQNHAERKTRGGSPQSFCPVMILSLPVAALPCCALCGWRTPLYGIKDSGKVAAGVSTVSAALGFQGRAGVRSRPTPSAKTSSASIPSWKRRTFGRRWPTPRQTWKTRFLNWLLGEGESNPSSPLAGCLTSPAAG